MMVVMMAVLMIMTMIVTLIMNTYDDVDADAEEEDCEGKARLALISQRNVQWSMYTYKRPTPTLRHHPRLQQ